MTHLDLPPWLSMLPAWFQVLLAVGAALGASRTWHARQMRERRVDNDPVAHDLLERRVTVMDGTIKALQETVAAISNRADTQEANFQEATAQLSRLEAEVVTLKGQIADRDLTITDRNLAIALLLEHVSLLETDIQTMAGAGQLAPDVADQLLTKVRALKREVHKAQGGTPQAAIAGSVYIAPYTRN